jgi:hypothetical protein
MVGKFEQFEKLAISYQPPNAHVRNSRILLGNAMAAGAREKDL